MSSYPRLRLHTRPAYYFRAAWEILSGRWRQGDDVARLEYEIETRFHVPHAIAMPMGRAAIYQAIRASVPPGGSLILSPYTIADVVNMVICAGAVPVFGDVERRGCNISAAEIERLLDEGRAAAVMVTHFHGEACDIERIAALCLARKAILIEDAAQAFGARVAGRPLGTFGDIGIFSFGLFKNVTSFYGGMMVTRSDEIACKTRAALGSLPYESAIRYIRILRMGLLADIVTWPPLFALVVNRVFRFGYLHGIKAITNRFKFDLNPQRMREFPKEYRCRMTPLQARLVLGQLDGVEREQDERIAIASRYHEALRKIPDLTLPPMIADGGHAYLHYAIEYAPREALVRFVVARGRDIQESYHRDCSAVPCFAEFARHCPNAAAAAVSTIYLPVYPGLPTAEIDRTIDAIADFFGG